MARLDRAIPGQGDTFRHAESPAEGDGPVKPDRGGEGGFGSGQPDHDGVGWLLGVVKSTTPSGASYPSKTSVSARIGKLPWLPARVQHRAAALDAAATAWRSVAPASRRLARTPTK